MDGQRATVGTLLALLAAVGAWLLLSRHIVGFRIRITAMPPARRASPASSSPARCGSP